MDSLANLLQKQEELSTKINVLRKQQKKEALAQIVELAQKCQLTLPEITTALNKTVPTTVRKRGKVPPKYSDPVTGIRWTGRGKAPAWIVGKNRDLFLLKK